MKARSALLVAVLIGGAAGTAGTAIAGERAIRRFDTLRDADLDRARALAEDAAGFLWIGDGTGLVRFDGEDFARMHADVVARGVDAMVGHQAGVAVLDSHGFLYLVDGTRAAPIAPPVADARVGAIAGDGAGRLLAVAGGRLWRREAAGWQERPLHGAPAPRVIAAGTGDDLWLGAAGEVWQLTADRADRRFESPRVIVAIAVRDAREVWIADFEAVHVMRDGVVTTPVPPAVPGRRVDLVIRGDTVWASLAGSLVAIHGDGTTEIVGAAEELDSGGALLVDHEGSLWVGSFRGLYQLPEPDTRAWNRHDGLPSHNVRRLTRGPQGLWVTTWDGATLLGAHGVDSAAAVFTRERICLDGDDVPWAATLDGMASWREGRWHHVPVTEPGRAECVRSADGGLWFTMQQGLVHVPRGGTPRHVRGPWSGPDRPYLAFIIEAADGELWLTSTTHVCHAPASAVRDDTAAWTCITSPNPGGRIIGLVEVAPGELWIAVLGAGVFSLERDRWQLVAGDRHARAAEQLVRSPRGGIWVLGQAVIQRVEPADAGWRIVETPSAWHGVPVSSAVDAVEAPDGRLWLATDAGVVEVPPSARFTPIAPPPVAVLDVRVDGVPRAPAARVEIGPDARQLELRFRAPSFRDSSRLRYRYRMAPSAAWSPPTSQATLRLANLRPGSYRIEVAASLDGETWSPVPARLDLVARAPWFRRWYVWPASIAVALALAWIGYRIRVAMLRREQAQRMAIARDLHDEIGAGLGSIGLLAGVVGDAEVGTSERASLATRISTTASELGDSLGDLVWSLRHHDPSIGAVAERLVARARDLFGGGDTVVCAVVPEPLPIDRVTLAARRHLLLIGLEALNNIAKHARCSRVEIGLAAVGHRRYQLWIADDGRGIDAPSEGRGSHFGLDNMRARAARIGARLSIVDAAPGTRIELDVRCQRP